MKRSKCISNMQSNDSFISLLWLFKRSPLIHAINHVSVSKTERWATPSWSLVRFSILFRLENLSNWAYFVFFKVATSSFVVHLTTGNRCDLVYTFNCQEPFEQLSYRKIKCILTRKIWISRQPFAGSSVFLYFVDVNEKEFNSLLYIF